VNPLGGTLVADASSFTGGFPPPPAASGYDPNAAAAAAPPASYASAPPAYGSQPPPAAGMVPSPPAAMAPMEDDNYTVPGTVGGPNPIVTVLLIVLTCGIYGIYLLIKGKKQQSQG
jgi:hypothetical protein